MGQIILPDTSLCAIVRDEMINPAGGIRKFVEAHAPYVEEAVIVDTGSVDGTREELEQLQSEHTNLQVYDRPFDNYVNSRNRSLSKVKTRRAFILDADELVTQVDFNIIRLELRGNPSSAFWFEFIDVEDDGEKLTGSAHHVRLFDKKKRFFNSYHGVSRCREFLYELDKKKWHRQLHTSCHYLSISKAKIHHFMVPNRSLIDKYDNWYSQGESFWRDNPPSKVQGFTRWKKLNPQRFNYQ